MKYYIHKADKCLHFYILKEDESLIHHLYVNGKKRNTYEYPAET
jgi:hypothetical protein